HPRPAAPGGPRPRAGSAQPSAAGDERVRSARDHRGGGAPRPALLLRRGQLHRRPRRPDPGAPGEPGPLGGHGRGGHQRPRRHARREGAVVQDVALRGVLAGAADPPRAGHLVPAGRYANPVSLLDLMPPPPEPGAADRAPAPGAPVPPRAGHLVPAGRYANPVSLLDLMPTLLELGGADGATSAAAEATTPARQGLSLLESARRERSGTAGPADRDVIIEYLAE